MLSTWVCSHALGSVCSVFWWGMRLHMHVESLVWSETAVGFYEVRIVQPGWKLCNWWRWQSIGCCCLSSQNMHSSQPLPIGNKYVVVTDLDVLFLPCDPAAVVRMLVWACISSACLVILNWRWHRCLVSMWNSPMIWRWRLSCAVPPWEVALCACAFLVWTVKCSFTACTIGLARGDVSPAVQTSFRLPGWLDFVTSHFDKILWR